MTDDFLEIAGSLLVAIVIFATGYKVASNFACEPQPEPTPAAQYDDGLHSLLVPEAQP